jgi:hypothetical protein
MSSKLNEISLDDLIIKKVVQEKIYNQENENVLRIENTKDIDYYYNIKKKEIDKEPRRVIIIDI